MDVSDTKRKSVHTHARLMHTRTEHTHTTLKHEATWVLVVRSKPNPEREAERKFPHIRGTRTGLCLRDMAQKHTLTHTHRTRCPLRALPRKRIYRISYYTSHETIYTRPCVLVFLVARNINCNLVLNCTNSSNTAPRSS